MRAAVAPAADRAATGVAVPAFAPHEPLDIWQARGSWNAAQQPLEACPALVLNADFQPLSYYPLSLWSWQDALKAVCQDRVMVVTEYDRVVRSPQLQMRLPSVIALKDFVQPSKHPAFTRFNVFLRDRFCCQYCARRLPTPQLTFDHVTPRSRGGRTSWTNIVAACGPCNLRKGSKLPKEVGMQPRRLPAQPTIHQLQENGRGFPPNHLHETWRDYLYWDIELEIG